MKTGDVLLTGLGLGRSPIAPGTAGSLLPIVVVVALLLAGATGWVIDGALLALGLLFGIACVLLGTAAEERTGGEDPQWIVADEVAGQSLTLLLLPWRAVHEPNHLPWNLTILASAFAAFRLFDITKPPPANQLQRLHGGWGILIDDLVAGVYALVVMQLVTRLLLPMLAGGG